MIIKFKRKEKEKETDHQFCAFTMADDFIDVSTFNHSLKLLHFFSQKERTIQLWKEQRTIEKRTKRTFFSFSFITFSFNCLRAFPFFPFLFPFPFPFLFWFPFPFSLSFPISSLLPLLPPSITRSNFLWNPSQASLKCNVRFVKFFLCFSCFLHRIFFSLFFL